MSEMWDVIVAGGGPAGLSAALMLGRSRRRVLVVDVGSPRNRFAAHIHGVLGNEGTPPGELLEHGRTEAVQYGVEFQNGAIESVQNADAELAVTISGGRTERARALIVATGITDELPDVAGLAQRWGTTVLHCPYCHGWEVRDQHLGVLMTSPAGIHQAQLVRQWSDRITAFSANALDPVAERRLRSRGVEVVIGQVAEILGEGDRISGVRMSGGEVIAIDAIFTGGFPRPHDGFLADVGLERSEAPFGMGSFLTVDPAGRTSNPRVWAVGNVVNPTANVPISIGMGALTGGAVNGALVEEDFGLALASEAANV